MHQIQFRLGSAPDPAGGAYSAPPDPLAGFKRPTSKGREGREEKGGEEDWEGERGGDGREGKGGEGRGGEGGGRRRKGKGERGGDVEGFEKWSAPGPALALGGPANSCCNIATGTCLI